MLQSCNMKICGQIEQEEFLGRLAQSSWGLGKFSPYF